MNNQYTKYVQFYCDYCCCIFQINTPIKAPSGSSKKKIHCPECCSNRYISEYIPEVTTEHVKGEKIKKLRWTNEELTILNSCIKGKISNHQVAIMLGRSITSVNKRKKRIMDTMKII